MGRQIDLIEDGGEVQQETRLFDPRTGETRSMRSKEEAHDYRYFPDPDLLPLVLSDEFIETIRSSLPEMPDQKKARFVEQFGLKPYDAGVLAGDKASSDFFEKVVEGRDARLAANWVTGELFGALNKLGVEIEASPVSADSLGELIDLISDDTISGRIAKDVFEIMLETGDAPGKIVEEKGLKQVTDTGAIEAIVDEVIAQNPDKAAEAKEKPKLAGWFVGQVMKASQGKANPAAVNKILAEKLGL